MSPNDISEQTFKRKNLLAQASYIQEGFSQFPQDMTEEGLLLVGPSGSGKSTLANYLLETPLIKWSIEIRDGLSDALKEKYKGRRIDHVYPDFDQEDRLDIPKIGSIGSTTRLITAYRARSILLIDTPGFNDTDNNRQLANALMLEQMISQSKKIKLAMVIDFNAIVAGQGDLFNDFTELLSQLFFLEQLHSCLSLNNILFVFMDKRGGLINASRIRNEIDCFVATLELRKESAESSVQFNLLERQIQICSIIKQTPNQRLIFVNPLDGGESRRQILSAVEPMPPIDNTIFNFNTSKKIEFRRKLQNDFILPYLDLMRCERIRSERQNLNESYRLQLLAYEQLPDTTKRRKKISEDLEKEETNLIESRHRLSDLKEKLNTAEQQLQNDLKPDEEIEYVTMTGDKRAYTLIEGSSLTGLVGTVGYAGYSAYLATYSASVATFFCYNGGVISSYGLSVAVAGPVSAFGVAFGFAILPAAVILTGAILAKKYATRYVENTYDLEVNYTGECLTKTEIRYQEIAAPDANTWVDYYEIDPEKIVISPDHRQCTAKFRKRQAQGTQQSQALCIIGKRENHPVIGRFVTGLRNEIAGLKTDIIGFESRVAMSEKIVSILKILENSTDESTLGNLLATLNAIDMQNESDESLTALINIRQAIEAINILLTYISVTDIFSDYQNEYAKLRKRHSEFATSSNVEAQEKASIKHNYTTYDADTTSFSVPILKKEDTETMTSTKEEIQPQILFLNNLKKKILSVFDTYLSTKDLSKRKKYKQNIVESLDLVFEGTEFRELIFTYVHSIPDSEIPILRGKEEYLVSMINYDEERIKIIYRPVKDTPVQSMQSEFSQNIANYIYDYWSAVIISEDKSDETAEEKLVLTALHERLQGCFQLHKPTLRNGTFFLADRANHHLEIVLDSLRDSVFNDMSYRAEILGYYRSVTNAVLPNNETKTKHLLNLIRYDEKQILAMYKLAMNVKQGPHSEFAADVVRYIKNYWQPLFPKKTSFKTSSAALTTTTRGLFAGVSVDANSRLFEQVSESQSGRAAEGVLHNLLYVQMTAQIDQKMTVFKSSFIHFIEKTYRLFYVLVNESVKSTKETALSNVSGILRSTEITTGVNIPFIGSIEINLPSVVASIIDLYVMVDTYLDKIKMRQLCDAFPQDETQRFNAITLAALKLSVELAPELYHMPDGSITVLAELVVKRIVSYITSHPSHSHLVYPSKLERGWTDITVWMNLGGQMSPTKRKDVTTICQEGMRTALGTCELSKIGQVVKAGDPQSPTYHDILDHSGRVIVQENGALIFTRPKHGNAFCMAQSLADVRALSEERGVLPDRLQGIVDVCAEVYQSEMDNNNPVIAENIFSYRRQQTTTEVNLKVGVF